MENRRCYIIHPGIIWIMKCWGMNNNYMRANRKITKETASVASRIYEKYKNDMFIEAKKILKDHSLAEDAVHHAMVRIMNKLEKTNDKEEKITIGFLKIVTRNVAIDIYNSIRKSNCNLEYIESWGNEDIENLSSEKTPCDNLILKEESNRIIKAIYSIPEKYRDVLLLEKLYEYSQKEIASILNISLDAVKKRSQRAKKILANELGNEE